MNIINVCKDCGELAEVNEEKSNENWIVYDTECKHCGGKVEMKFK
ncbi:hypothetical protein GCM10008986_16660 [Salinibacillus aidingensis]|uniref:SR1 protein n=1 Tax=Salinibacillus aidingensis TaxID=237684 RepID=A0ABN1B6B4_9BACI